MLFEFWSQLLRLERYVCRTEGHLYGDLTRARDPKSRNAHPTQSVKLAELRRVRLTEPSFGVEENGASRILELAVTVRKI